MDTAKEACEYAIRSRVALLESKHLDSLHKHSYENGYSDAMKLTLRLIYNYSPICYSLVLNELKNNDNFQWYKYSIPRFVQYDELCCEMNNEMNKYIEKIENRLLQINMDAYNQGCKDLKKFTICDESKEEGPP